MTRATVKQCKSCPWRVDCVPDRDIPNGYSVELHRGLRGTIREGVQSLTGGLLRVSVAVRPARPEELAPVQPIGRMTLNRAPANFFAEVEQAAFNPAKVRSRITARSNSATTRQDRKRGCSPR